MTHTFKKKVETIFSRNVIQLMSVDARLCVH